MKEYIEREAAINAILSLVPKVDCDGYCWVIRGDAARAIDSIPAADVRPVVRGRWIRHYEQADTGEDIITYPCGWVCSGCGRWESDDEPFCNCGADMREES